MAEPRVAAITKAYLAKTLDLQTAKIELNKILDGLRAAADLHTDKYPDANLDLLAKAVKQYENRRLNPRSRTMAAAALRRCVNLLGSTVLHSASKDDLTHIVLRQPLRSRPKVALYLNVLLRTAGRPERLKVPAAPDLDVKYLTREDFESILKHIPRAHQLPIIATFATGCRLGEIFALSRYGRTASVFVERQMLPKAPWYDVTKTKKKRWAPVMEWARDEVKEWIKVLAEMGEHEKIEMRQLEWYEIVRAACKTAFPNQPHKHLTFRDIRHCYAIYWLDKGASLRNVAQAMGNSEKVVLKHYSGYIQTDEAEKLMLALEVATAE